MVYIRLKLGLVNCWWQCMFALYSSNLWFSDDSDCT